MFDLEPFQNNPTFRHCAACKSKVTCGKKDKCLLRKAAREFSSRFSSIFELLGAEDIEFGKPKPGPRGQRSRRRRKRKPPEFKGAIATPAQARKAQSWMPRTESGPGALPDDLGVIPPNQGTVSPASDVGPVKSGITRYKRHGATVKDSKGNVIHKKGDPIIRTDSAGRRTHVTETKSVIPQKTLDKLQSKTDDVKAQIAREKGKLAYEHQQEVREVGVRGKNVKPGAKATIRPKDPKNVVLTQRADAVDRAGNPTGKKSRHVPKTPPPSEAAVASRRREAADLSKSPASKARKASFDKLPPAKKAAVLAQTRKNFGLNERGAKKLLRGKGGLRKAFGRISGKVARTIAKLR